jgi:hypothetical protein
VSYNAGANGYYVGVHDFFAGPLVNGPPTAPAGAGIFGDAGFPNMGPYKNASYFADIVFTDDIGAAAIRLQGNGLDIADGDTTLRTADGTDFGDVELEAGLVERTFTLSNPGQLDLEITGNSTVVIAGPQAGDFTVTAEPDALVPAGGTTTFAIQFHPSAPGLRTATVVITNNATPANAFYFAIAGTGVEVDPNRQTLFFDPRPAPTPARKAMPTNWGRCSALPSPAKSPGCVSTHWPPNPATTPPASGAIQTTPSSPDPTPGTTAASPAGLRSTSPTC